jgi:hypothetical protein
MDTHISILDPVYLASIQHTTTTTTISSPLICNAPQPFTLPSYRVNSLDAQFKTHTHIPWQIAISASISIFHMIEFSIVKQGKSKSNRREMCLVFSALSDSLTTWWYHIMLSSTSFDWKTVPRNTSHTQLSHHHHRHKNTARTPRYFYLFLRMYPHSKKLVRLREKILKKNTITIPFRLRVPRNI